MNKTDLDLAFEIDELCQQGLNNPDPNHWEAALQEILDLVREYQGIQK